MRPPKVSGKVELESEKKITGHRDFIRKKNNDRGLSKSSFKEK